MIKLNKKKTKAFGIRTWWLRGFCWIPTIKSEIHLVPYSCLTSLYIENNYSAKGNNIEIDIYIFAFMINIEYWWKLKENYERKY